MTDHASTFDVLLDAYPAFRPAWEEGLCGDFLDADGHLLPYIALASLTRHVLEVIGSSRQEQLRPLFVAVEMLCGGEDPCVRELMVIGLLEGIQNVGRNKDVDVEVLVGVMGPMTRSGWDALNAYWAGLGH